MFKDNVDSIVSRLENLISTKTIVGEPIMSGSVTVIPILTASFGFGLGGGEGTHAKGEAGKGSGGGAGAKLTPTAMVVIQGNDVKVHLLTQKSALAELAEIIPEALAKFACRKDQQTSDAE
ncbi:MAG: spore germination protein GerW family protein [Clostridia bacterium]|nr:spore germination protein GerW family protein [Clostridia bacterium]MDQ7790750.1 spore germination protein GerW family protein [Clostridia bacterium]